MLDMHLRWSWTALITSHWLSGTSATSFLSCSHGCDHKHTFVPHRVSCGDQDCSTLDPIALPSLSIRLCHLHAFSLYPSLHHPFLPLEHNAFHSPSFTLSFHQACVGTHSIPSHGTHPCTFGLLVRLSIHSSSHHHFIHPRSKQPYTRLVHPPKHSNHGNPNKT